MAIAPRPIKCGAKLTDGSECQQFATVTNMRYIYDRKPALDGVDDLILNEIHYSATCPECGDRTVVEKQ